MTPVVDELLISIRPNYADAIFDGSKAVEVRRKIPSIAPGARLWIYVTMPVGQVRGFARVAKIVEGDPNTVWRVCGSRTGLAQKDFFDYLHGSAKAYGIVLQQVEIGRPVSIAEMKTLRANFHPPQVITRLSIAEAEGLCEYTFPARAGKVASMAPIYANSAN